MGRKRVSLGMFGLEVGGRISGFVGVFGSSWTKGVSVLRCKVVPMVQSGLDGLSRLRQLLASIRMELFPVGKKARRVRALEDVAVVRGEVAGKLVEAINVVEGLAQTSGHRSRQGSGGVPPKARWYQLMAYLAQVLDGVLRNIDLDKVEEKLGLLERTVDELQRQTPKAGG